MPMNTVQASIPVRLAGVRWRFWLPVMLLWLVYLAVVLLIYTHHPNGAGDFAYYYRGAVRLNQGRDLYGDLAPNDYIGPPLLVQVIAPVAAAADLRAASLVWFAANVAALFGTLALLDRYVTGPRSRLLLWIAPVFFVPTLMSFWHGQATVILCLLTVGAWAAIKEDKPVLAGVLLAVGAWIKFYPGLLILYFLWKRAWRVVIGALAAGVLLGLVQMVGVGPQVFFGYFTDVLPGLLAEGQPHLSHSNQSVLGFALRLFADVPQVVPLAVSPALFNLTRLGLMLALLGGTLWLISRPIWLTETPRRKFDLEYALVLIDALLLGSTLWLAGMFSLLLVYVALLREAPRRSRRRLALWCVLTFALIALHLFLGLGILRPPSENTLPGLALSTPFFGVLILWGLVAAQARRLKLPVPENH
jgi:hypothetical protein